MVAGECLQGNLNKFAFASGGGRPLEEQEAATLDAMRQMRQSA